MQLRRSSLTYPSAVAPSAENTDSSPQLHSTFCQSLFEHFSSAHRACPEVAWFVLELLLLRLPSLIVYYRNAKIMKRRLEMKFHLKKIHHCGRRSQLSRQNLAHRKNCKQVSATRFSFTKISVKSTQQKWKTSSTLTTSWCLIKRKISSGDLKRFARSHQQIWSRFHRKSKYPLLRKASSSMFSTSTFLGVPIRSHHANIR